MSLSPAQLDPLQEFEEGLDLEPIDEKQVRAYYREDTLIWTLYLSMRRLDRWLHRCLFRREYPYILPGRTKRQDCRVGMARRGERHRLTKVNGSFGWRRTASAETGD